MSNSIKYFFYNCKKYEQSRNVSIDLMRFWPKAHHHRTVCREVVKIKFDFRLWILNFMFYICHKRSAASYKKEKSQKSLLLFEIFQGLYT